MRRLITLLVLTFVAPSYTVGNVFAKERCAHAVATNEPTHDRSHDGRDQTSHEHGAPAEDAACPHDSGSIACTSGGTSICEAAYVRISDDVRDGETPVFNGPARLASYLAAPEPPPPKT